jgi:DNA mismatch repair protein MutS
MGSDTELTPMMAQYRRIKGELPEDALLLFRLGDFYELFFEDARIGAQLLNVALTKRGAVPMCGIPFHAAGGYVAKILKAGRKVAICDQMEDARAGQLVKREVTQILSPGTHFDERMLSAERNNYLAAICAFGKILGLAFVDLTTGDFKTTELEDPAALLTELERLRPAEIIYPGENAALASRLSGRNTRATPPGTGNEPRATAEPAVLAGVSSDRASGWILNGYDDWVFAPETAQFTLRDHFKVAALDGFGLKDRAAAIGAAGAVLHYLTQHLRRDVRHLTRLSFYQCTDYLVLDAVTLRHLEILEPLHRDAPKPGSLYAAVNRTVTPMGARRLRDWLSQPLAAVEPIQRRQELVQMWIDHSQELQTFRACLAEVRDLERTISRLSVGTGNARDLLALQHALEQIPALKQVLNNAGQASSPPDDAFKVLDSADSDREAVETGWTPVLLVTELKDQISDLPDLVELLSRAVVDEPPATVKEGGMIREGFDTNLDELCRGSREGKEWIARLQQQEIERTGIASLKVRFNSVFGYYIEVTKANLDKTPPHYIRKQTIANGERFITPELKEMEGKILGAEERSIKLEYELFLRVREAVIAQLPAIQQTASALAQLDVLAAFAETARHFNYGRPHVADAGVLQIRDGRHPVLDQALTEERFVPNDAELASVACLNQSAPLSPPQTGKTGTPSGDAPGDRTEKVTPCPDPLPSEGERENAIRHPQIMLITGPNMAGKSTYIRQVALLALLAHTGSFIPAVEARIDLVDRIFTRIGASDDLARGQSTFMVEMSETANILNNATPRSLVVLDEIGRGTSTFDGLSLAWSIVEFLHNQVGAKTLFATHYHELTELAARLRRLRNFNVAVREWHDQIVFLRKIVAGGTDKSYGIQVARLAGVPKIVLDRAKEILRNLEESELTPEGNVRQPARQRAEREKLQKLGPAPQLDLFGRE